MRRKGELGPHGVDSGWPYQVAIREDLATGINHTWHRKFCTDNNLSLCPRGHAVVFEGDWYQVLCFAEKSDADLFLKECGGEPFNPKDRGKGSSWMKWEKGKHKPKPKGDYDFS